MKLIVSSPEPDTAPEPAPIPGESGKPRSRARPAHRPSRRLQIVGAATSVFAQQGYVEANVEDIARAAGVAPTAIYYHFGGKEELFTQSLRTATHNFSEHIFTVRPDAEPGTVDALRTVLRSGWQYWLSHPDEARLVARYSEGSTVQAVQIRREWEERHLERAYDYIAPPRSPRSTRKVREQRAAHSLNIRLLVDVLLATQAFALDDALGGADRDDVVSAAESLCVELVESLR